MVFPLSSTSPRYLPDVNAGRSLLSARDFLTYVTPITPFPSLISSPRISPLFLFFSCEDTSPRCPLASRRVLQAVFRTPFISFGFASASSSPVFFHTFSVPALFDTFTMPPIISSRASRSTTAILPCCSSLRFNCETSIVNGSCDNPPPMPPGRHGDLAQARSGHQDAWRRRSACPVPRSAETCRGC